MNANATNGNILDTLVQQLSAEERASMLSKITPLIEEYQEQPVYASEADKQNAITEHTKNIYNNKGFFYKLQVFLMRIFEGTTKTEAITHIELQNTVHNIRSHYGILVDTKTGSLTGSFIKEFAKLAKLCDNIKTTLDNSLFDSEFYVKFVSDMLEHSQSDSQKKLASEAYPQSLPKEGSVVTKNDYANEKDKRIKRYFNSIELSSFTALNDMLKRYEILARLIKFDYKHFFMKFGISDFDAAIPHGASCIYLDISDQLLRLFRLIASVTFDITDVGIFLTLTEWYKDGSHAAKKETVFSQDEYNKVESIIDACKQIQRRIPMQDILVCMQSELLYRLTPITVNYDITLIYKEYKRTILSKVWNDYFATLKEENLAFMSLEMFSHEYNYYTLHYLTPHFKQQLEWSYPIKLPYIHKLNLMTEFLGSVYKAKIEPVINRIINDGDFKKDKVHNDITSGMYLLSNYEHQIRNFDEKYSPHKDPGKMFHQYLSNINNTEKALSDLIAMANQLNEECHNYISELSLSFKQINDFLETINDVHNPHNIPILNSNKIKIPGHPNLFVAVEQTVSLFNKFSLMLDLTNDIYK